MASLSKPQSSSNSSRKKKQKTKKHTPKNPEENTLKLTLGQNSPYTDAKGRQIPSKKTNCQYLL